MIEDKTLIRILYVNGGLMNRGGIESFMMNYYRHFDRTKVQIDFIVHNAGGFGYYDEEIKQLGGKIYTLPQKSKHPLTYVHQLKKILKNGQYKVIHTHMDAMGAWVLKAAKECNIPVRIAHSHNTQHLTSNPIKLWFLERARKSITKYATHCFACSDVAGKWLFGNTPFEIVHNAIDVQKFQFDADVRSQIRKEYGIGDDDFLIGHVGRFDTQKNHTFLIDVFADVQKLISNAKLMLIGEGAMKEYIELKCKQMLMGGAIFTGGRNDVFRFYNAFDLFVLPSLFEGLCIVSIEAQANGCSNLLSSTITQEVNVSGKVKFAPLKKDDWVKAIVDIYNNRTEHDSCVDLRKAGYDLETESQLLQAKYEELWNLSLC